MAYYYLAASLPSVSLETRPPVSREDFMRSCHGVLSESDYREAMLVMEGRESEASHPAVARWRARDTQLRNAVARARATKAGIDVSGFLRRHEGFDVALEQGVAEAVSRANPLEREVALDLLRWRMAEDLALEAPFDMPAIFAFILKLRLAERRQGWNEEKARETFETLVQKTMQETNHG